MTTGIIMTTIVTTLAGMGVRALSHLKDILELKIRRILAEALADRIREGDYRDSPEKLGEALDKVLQRASDPAVKPKGKGAAAVGAGRGAVGPRGGQPPTKS
ncbi:hypothetical protein [Longispora urticae]